jgi:hypothetical protein
MKRKSKVIAISGLLTAVIVVLFFISSIIDVLDYTVSALCGIIVTFIFVEFGKKSAISVYLASSILTLILIPNKLSPILFVLFCGWYPFLKERLERLKNSLSVILKLLSFNAVLILILAFAKFVFLIEDFSTVLVISVILTANFSFILYDVLITRLIFLYVNKYRKLFKFLK